MRVTETMKRLNVILVCQNVNSYLETMKIPDDLKKETLSISCVVHSIVEEEDAEEIEAMLNAMSVFYQVTQEDMAREQCKDTTLGIVYQYVTGREKLKSSTISRIKLKAIKRYSVQFDRLTFKQRVLQ